MVGEKTISKVAKKLKKKKGFLFPTTSQRGMPLEWIGGRGDGV